MITVGEKIPGVDVQSLVIMRSVYFHKKLLVLILVTAALIASVLLAPGLAWLLLSLLLGLSFAHAVELQHQCLHNTAYHSKFWNNVVGVILGLPLLVSFSDYQNSHFRHHRLLGTPEDKEFFDYSYQKLTSLRGLILHLWMVRHYRGITTQLFNSAIGRLPQREEATLKVAKRIRFEYQIMAVAVVGMAVASVVFQTPIFLKLWLIPFLVAVPTHALIELPEHIGCDSQTANLLINTRTIKAGKIAMWFVDGNNYHVEHHWLPGVPNDKLHILHSHIHSRIKYLDESYISFYQKFFKNLYEGNLHRLWK